MSFKKTGNWSLGASTQNITLEVLYTCWKKTENLAQSCLAVDAKIRK